jgi:hypothetical protein
MKRLGRILLLTFFFVVMLWTPSLEANPSRQDLCETLHADYLLKAQKALKEDRLEDALRFLLDAQTVAKTCADSSEGLLPQRQIRESNHAFAPEHCTLS